jgi:hypothetical protein
MTPDDLMRALGMEPNAWQSRVFADPTGRYVGRRRAGATTAALVLALHRCLAGESELVLLISPNMYDMEATLAEWRDRIGIDWWQEYRWRYEFPNDSRLFLIAPDPAKVVGLRPTLIVVDWWNDTLVVMADAARRALGFDGDRIVYLETR